MERRLAAIFAADVVGYSRLMGEDEAGTLERLKSLRKELVQPKITERKGRIVKLMGDGLLAEFPSVVEAVQCAVDIQQSMVGRETELRDDRRIKLRTGVHLGDVIIEGRDIYGEGVNIAARLQENATPGGLSLSNAAYEHLDKAAAADFTDAGEQNLKNIRRPVRIWRWPRQTDDRLGSKVAAPTDTGEAVQLEVPTLAILPFHTLGDDAEHSFLADGLVEELNTMLGQISGLIVISRGSTTRYRETGHNISDVARALGARYVLNGSVRVSGTRVRVNAKLLDAGTAVQLWAERYDANIDDVFDLQDQLTREIVTALRLRLTDGEQARIWLRSTENVNAWRAAMRAADLVWQGTPTAMARARELFEQAVTEDPDYAAAYGYLALTHYFDLRFGFTGDTSATRAAMIAAAQDAISRDPENAYALFIQANVLTFDDRFDEAIGFIKAAIARNPNDAVIRLAAARILINADRPSDGEREIRMAMRLNPHYPVNYSSVLANALIDLKRYDEADNALVEVTARKADYLAAHLQRTYLETLRKNHELAKQSALEVLRIDPEYTIAKAANYYISSDRVRKWAFLESLRSAGVPE